MTYEEFLEKLKDEIASRKGISKNAIKFCPKGCIPDTEAERALIHDENKYYEGSDSDAALLDILNVDITSKNGFTPSIGIDTRSLYQKAQKEGFEAAVEHVFEADRSNYNYDSIRARTDGEYEAVKPYLIIRLLSMEKHGDDLKRTSSVYLELGDIAIVLYQLIGDGAVYSTIRITENDMKHWNLCGEEARVMAEAADNTARLYPAVLYNPSTHSAMDVLHENYSREDFLVEGSGYLTAEGTPNGASALFYPGVRRKLSEVMGGAFLAVFLNTLDIEILQIGSPQLTRALDIAGSQTPYGEPLSNMVYLCTEDGCYPNPVHYEKGSDARIITINAMNEKFEPYDKDKFK